MIPTILPRDEFLTRFGGPFARVFRSTQLNEGVFADKSFLAIALPGDAFGEEEEMCLSRSFRAVGDQFMVLTNVESIPPHVESIVVGIDRFWRHAKSTSEASITVFTCAGFGTSCRWGLWIDKFYECRVVAGDAEVIGSVVKGLGGLPCLQEHMSKHANTFWKLSALEKEDLFERNLCRQQFPGGRPRQCL